MTHRTPASALATRARLRSLSCVAAYLTLTSLVVPDSESRAHLHYAVVITIGYGHLIGSLVFGRRRIRSALQATGSPGLVGASLLSSISLLFAAYQWGLHHFPMVLIPLLATAAWHTVENDLVLGQTYAARMRLPPVDWSWGALLPAIGFTALILAPAGQTLRESELGPALSSSLLEVISLRDASVLLGRGLAIGTGALIFMGVGARPQRHHHRRIGLVLVAGALLLPPRALTAEWLSFGDVFAATTLHHLISWLLLLRDRIHLGLMPGRPVQGLIWVHLLPAALCLALLALPRDTAPDLRDLVFSPAIYLFWSMLHVVQTALMRSGAATGAKADRHGSGITAGSKEGSAATFASIGQ